MDSQAGALIAAQGGVISAGELAAIGYSMQDVQGSVRRDDVVMVRRGRVRGRDGLVGRGSR